MSVLQSLFRKHTNRAARGGTIAMSTAGVPNYSEGVRTEVSIDNVNDTTPTEAECVAAFGAAATVGAGFVGVINDAGGGVNVYVCVSTGAKWGWTKLTIAS